MTLKVKITGRVKVPKLDFTTTLLQVGKKDISARLAKNIQKGVDLKERAYPPLNAKTVRAKGHASPLIETGKLHSSFLVERKGKNTVLIRIKTARRKIAEFLQVKGVRTKNGKRFFNFFGVSTRMEKDGIRRMEKEIKKRVASAGR